MTQNGTEQPRGAQLRRRVRGLTVGVTGAAVLASAGVTATIAYSQSHEKTNTSAAVPVTGDAAGSDGSTSSSGSSSNDAGESDDSFSSSGSGRLVAPIQPPTWPGGTGGGSITGHANSGGS